MKPTHLTLAFTAFLSAGASAASLAGPASTQTADPGRASNGVVILGIGTAIDLPPLTETNGTASAGNWSATAGGALFVGLSAIANVDTRAMTQLTPTTVNFNLSTAVGGVVGDVVGTLGANLGSLGIAQQWGASVNATSAGNGGLGMTFASNTTYAFSFDLTANTGLLGGSDLLQANVLNSLTFTARDSNGQIATATGNSPGLLGLVQLTDPEDGRVTFTFTTPGSINGNVFIDIEATNLASTNLNALSSIIGNTSDTDTIYSLSGFDISVVPEPGSMGLLGLGALGLLRRRRA